MATSIPVGFKALITLSDFRDAQGNPTSVDAITGYSVSNPATATIQAVGPDTFVVATGVGDAQQVLVDVDVRLGPDVRNVQFIGTFDVPAGEAATATVTLGEIIPA